MKRFLSTLIARFLLLATSQAATYSYYVSPSGSDTGDGSQQKPLRSASVAVNRAVSLLKSKPNSQVDVIFLPGTYKINESIEINGNNLKGKIRLLSQQAGKAVFDGAAHISKFTVVRRKGNSKTLVADLSSIGIPSETYADYNRFEVYSNGVRQQIARYPNTGFIKLSDFNNSTLHYTDNMVDNAESGQSFLHGFWHYKWYDQYCGIESVNAAGNSIKISGSVPPYGFAKGDQFYVANAAKFLDAPGEYYMNRSNRKLYWIVAAATTSPVADIPCAKGTCFIKVTNMDNFEIDGLVFQSGVNRAIEIENGSNNTISRCKFVGFGADAINITNGTGHKVDGCYFETIGKRGISAVGGDRKTLKDCNLLITNNVFKRTSYFRYCYEQPVNFTGCGATISHNEFYDIPSSAIRINGNNVVTEYNKIVNAVQVSDDQGGFDIFGDPSYRGIVVRNNYWQNICDSTNSRMVAAVRLDDMISGAQVYGNIFDHCGSNKFGCVQIFGGKDNKIHDNVLYKCNKAVSQTKYTQQRWEESIKSARVQKLIYSDVDISSAAYRKAYPELNSNILSNADQNTISGNKVVSSIDSYSSAIAQMGTIGNMYK